MRECSNYTGPEPSPRLGWPNHHGRRELRLPRVMPLRPDCRPRLLRALNLIVHDQIKDGDYWRGQSTCVISMIWQNSRGCSQGVDWLHLSRLMRGRLRRNAFETQLLALRDLFDVPIPKRLGRRLVPRVQHWRRMAQIRHPRLAMPLRFAGAVAWVGRRVRTKDVPRFTVTDFVPRVLRKLMQGRRQVA